MSDARRDLRIGMMCGAYLVAIAFSGGVFFYAYLVCLQEWPKALTYSLLTVVGAMLFWKFGFHHGYDHCLSEFDGDDDDGEEEEEPEPEPDPGKSLDIPPSRLAQYFESVN